MYSHITQNLASLHELQARVAYIKVRVTLFVVLNDERLYFNWFYLFRYLMEIKTEAVL